jgi:hypothetical protein
MNRLHALTRIQREALVNRDEHTDGNAVWQAIREGWDTSVLSRSKATEFADVQLKQAKAIDFELERAKFLLDITEGELRADLLDALDTIDVSNPRVCREVFECHRGLGNSTGEASIREAIDLLGVAGFDEAQCADFARRLLELYPADPEDKEE